MFLCFHLYSPLTPLPLYVGGLTCIKSHLNWPWERCCSAGDSLLYRGLVAECCPRLQDWFVELPSKVLWHHVSSIVKHMHHRANLFRLHFLFTRCEHCKRHPHSIFEVVRYPVDILWESEVAHYWKIKKNFRVRQSSNGGLEVKNITKLAFFHWASRPRHQIVLKFFYFNFF